MANTNFNICTNWGLRCFEQKVTDKAVILRCSMNTKDKETGEYGAPTFIDVVCSFDHCEIAEGDYTKTFVNVDGQFLAGSYKNKAGEKVAALKIFATKVEKSEKA